MVMEPTLFQNSDSVVKFVEPTVWGGEAVME